MGLPSSHNYSSPTRIGAGWRVKKEAEAPIQCSLLKNPVVFIEPMPRQKIDLLMAKYPNQEWLGYLIGRVSEKENYFVEDLSIPPHTEASGASAEAEPFHIPDKCIGIIHSHHIMGAFHSGIDQNYVDKNFPISITVARKSGVLEFDAVSYQTTLCGKNTTAKGQVKYVQPEPVFDTEAFLGEATANVDKGRRTYAVQVHYPVSHQHLNPPRYQGVRYIGNKRVPFGQEDEEYFTDNRGGVLSQKQLNDIYRDVWKDKKKGDLPCV